MERAGSMAAGRLRAVALIGLRHFSTFTPAWKLGRKRPPVATRAGPPGRGKFRKQPISPNETAPPQWKARKEKTVNRKDWAERDRESNQRESFPTDRPTFRSSDTRESFTQEFKSRSRAEPRTASRSGGRDERFRAPKQGRDQPAERRDEFGTLGYSGRSDTDKGFNGARKQARGDQFLKLPDEGNDNRFNGAASVGRSLSAPPGIRGDPGLDEGLRKDFQRERRDNSPGRFSEGRARSSTPFRENPTANEMGRFNRGEDGMQREERGNSGSDRGSDQYNRGGSDRFAGGSSFGRNNDGWRGGGRANFGTRQVDNMSSGMSRGAPNGRVPSYRAPQQSYQGITPFYQPREPDPILKGIRDSWRGDALYGVNPVAAALLAGRREIHRLFYQESAGGKHGPQSKLVLQQAAAMGIPCSSLSKHDLNVLTDNASHQGLVLECEPLEFESMDDFGPPPASNSPLWIALDEVTDPHNMGAIIRSTTVLGATGILTCSKNSSPLSPAVSKEQQREALQRPATPSP